MRGSAAGVRVGARGGGRARVGAQHLRAQLRRRAAARAALAAGLAALLAALLEEQRQEGALHPAARARLPAVCWGGEAAAAERVEAAAGARRGEGVAAEHGTLEVAAALDARLRGGRGAARLARAAPGARVPSGAVARGGVPRCGGGGRAGGEVALRASGRVQGHLDLHQLAAHFGSEGAARRQARRHLHHPARRARGAALGASLRRRWRLDDQPRALRVRVGVGVRVR